MWAACARAQSSSPSVHAIPSPFVHTPSPRRQLVDGLAGVSAAEMERVVIAYEPVWAIGTGLTCDPDPARKVHKDVRGVIEDLYDGRVADDVRIQYGGSVNPETVDDIMAMPDIDGCLVGGASLVPEKFARIMNFQGGGNTVPVE